MREKEAEPDESTRAGFSKLEVLVGWVTQRKNGGHKISLFYKKLYFPTVKTRDCFFLLAFFLFSVFLCHHFFLLFLSLVTNKSAKCDHIYLVYNNLYSTCCRLVCSSTPFLFVLSILQRTYLHTNWCQKTISQTNYCGINHACNTTGRTSFYTNLEKNAFTPTR